ncbi:MAG: gluconokinase [Steroidobacteraceae bacterium]
MAIIIVMGVSGSGKSTIGRLLAERLACSFLEGDSLHSAANIERMASGIALTDADRRGWLQAIAQRIGVAARAAQPLVVTCSALKRRYRNVLRQADADLIFVHLMGERALIERRLAMRQNHFMPPALLDSQFAALEAPGADEQVIVCDIAHSPAEIVAAILERLPPQSPLS